MRETAVRNIRLTMRYDGTGFHGFQRQAGHRTVQEEVERAILRVTGEKVAVMGAGRTDAGVHALGQVANFRTVSAIPADRVPPALNVHLNREITVYRAEEAPPSFSARRDAVDKTYAYAFWVGAHSHPLLRLYSSHEARPLDVGAMVEASRHLVGRHDFTSFWSAGSVKTTPVRTVLGLASRREDRDDGRLLVFAITADGFLYRMVRNIMGFLREVGLGRRAPEEAARVLAALDRGQAGRAAQACGLCLVRVNYLPEAEGAPAAERTARAVAEWPAGWLGAP
jgi:tRNA pseudouridine38-40 synthase